MLLQTLTGFESQADALFVLVVHAEALDTQMCSQNNRYIVLLH